MNNHSPSSGPDTCSAAAECYGDPVRDLDRPLWDLFRFTTSKYPGHDAVVSLWQDARSVAPSLLSTPDGNSPTPDQAGPAIRWTYAELLQKSTDLARHLELCGCRRGMHIAVVLWNSAEWALFFWASIKLGLTFVPLDARSPDDNLQHCLQAVQPDIIVVQDLEIVRRLQGLLTKQSHVPELDPKLRITCSSEAGVAGWRTLEDVLVDPYNSFPEAEPPSNHQVEVQTNAPSVIVFTSGTTGQPKGCPLTSANIWSETCDFDPDPIHCNDRWCVHTPISHVFGINNSLRAWRFGGTAIFPSKSFEVKATLRALKEEQCTFMSAVPAVVKALISDSDWPGKDKLSLRYVTLGSTSISEDDIRLCLDTLLPSGDAIQCFGMSEGAPIVSWARTDPLFKKGFHAGCGKILPGANMRICKPGTREVLRRGEDGELHIGGTSVIDGYLGGVSKDSFYGDEGGNWFVTGDQARIDADGVLYIVGRYKDLIIRGGHNIVPATVERVLNQVDGITSQVVGVPDPVAGQLPVAVVKATKPFTKRALYEKTTSLGTQYALDAVYTLEELNLSGFPSTASGKIRKGELKDSIARYRETLAAPQPNGHHSAAHRLEQTEGELQEVWEGLIGIRPATDELITAYADSITALRYCDRVMTAIGKRLYLQDVEEHPTISDQAKLLEKRPSGTQEWNSGDGRSLFTSSQGWTLSPPIQDHTRFDISSQLPSSGSRDKATVRTAAAALVQSRGLDVDDIEGIIPIRDYYHRLASGPRIQSYRNRFLFRINSSQPSDLQRALETALSSRPMFRTLLCHAAEGPFHVVLQPSATLFAHLISSVTVHSDAERKALAQDSSADAFSSVFMFQAQIVTINKPADEVEELYLATTLNHAVFDALSLVPWHRDLDRLLAEPSYTPPPSTPYTMFADLLHLYRDALPAQQAVAHNLRRLRGLSRFPEALWPPQRAPGWFQGAEGSAAATPHAAERAATRDAVWGGAWEQKQQLYTPGARIMRIATLPHAEALRTQHRVDPALLAKAAVALFTALRTGAPWAVFNHLDAARAWPFVPRWLEPALPPPMSVDGPTFEFVLNAPRVDPRSGAESVRALLKRLGDEHRELGRHAHAPWGKVLEGLGEEAAVVLDASYRQSFVWDVSLRMVDAPAADFRRLEAVGRWDWADCGFFWNCCMLNKTNMMVVASWDSAQMNDDEVDGHCDLMTDVLRRLADPANLDKTLGEVFGAGLGV
ncbi:acetyl-CoA synthetase-like protein [Xylariomycetidae sp. FL0641]|nr:acetyl-CoA synthetase-like protein [Xylariomycetidae sp. FL0641]